MNVANRHLYFNGRVICQGSAHLGEQRVIERLIQSVFLGMDLTSRDASWHWRVVQNGGEINSSGFPMLDCGMRVQHVHATNHFIECSKSQLGHVFANLLSQEEEEVDDVLRLSSKLLAQNGILRSNAHRAGVEVAFAHHDATHRDQWRGGESELLCAE